MGLLLRVGFWLGLVVLLLPAAPAPPSASVSAGEAVSAAGAAVADVRQFCSRQHDACIVGWQALAQLAAKAQQGAKRLSALLSRLGSPTEAPGLQKNGARGLHGNASQHTLMPADLLPAWRGLGSRREAESKSGA